MIATDVVGRGIDVAAISHIINYDIPETLRRLRPSRRSHGTRWAKGVAFTFVIPDQGDELPRSKSGLTANSSAITSKGYRFPRTNSNPGCPARCRRDSSGGIEKCFKNFVFSFQ